jgi:hypothetical protein
MRVVIQLLEAISVFIPDLQVLSLSASVFFSLYCCVSALGLSWAKSVDSGLVVSLFFGYAVTVVLNIASFLSYPSASRAAAGPLCQRCSRTAVTIRRHADDAAQPLELHTSHICRFEKQPETPDSNTRFST